MTPRFRVLAIALVAVLSLAPLTAAPLELHAGAVLSSPSPAPGAAPGRALLALLAGALALGITIRADAGAIAAKFAKRAAGAQGDYKDGVSNAGQSWEAGARAGADNWEQGLNEAIADGRFEKGVQGKAGKYQANATALGPQRYAQGVQQASGAYQTGVQPYLDVLKSLTLPPRGARRSPANMQRANAVALALGNRKTGK